MNKTKTLKSLVVIAMLVAAMAVVYFVPAFALPGDSDPLVTQRFVEDKIAELNAEIAELRAIVNNITPGMAGGTGGSPLTGQERDALFSEFVQYFESVYGEFLNAALSAAGQAPGGAYVVPFTPLLIPAGSTLIGEAGAEFILRSGTATAVSGPDGMVNVTSGHDVVNGNNIPTNNLLLVPRSDGRGFYANTDVWVMIKGGHSIVN